MREGILVNLFVPLLGVIMLPYSIVKRNINYIYGWIIGFGLILGLSFGVEPGGTSDVIRGYSTYQNIQQDLPTLTFILTNLYQHHLLFDIFHPITLWLFSCFGASYSLYLGFVGLLYSIFFVALGKLYLSYNIGNPSYWQIFLLWLVFCIVPQWHAVNNIRFFLAVVVFAIGVFSKRSGYALLTIFVTPFIHFSMGWLASLWLVLRIINPKYNIKLGFILFITTLIASVDTLAIADLISQYVPDFAYDRVDSYTDKSFVEDKLENKLSVKGSRSLAGNIIDYGIPWMLLAMVLLIYLNKKYINKDEIFLFPEILYVGSVINILASLPSFGRFYYITLLIFIGLLMQLNVAVIKKNQLSKVLYFMFLGISSLYGIVKLRLLFYFLTVEFSMGGFNLFMNSSLFDRLLISDLF